MAMLTMTVAFADDEKNNVTNNAEAYEMNINVNKLGSALGLTSDQLESVADIHRTFSGELKLAAQASRDDRQLMVKKAVTKDLAYMHYVLNAEQYRKYVMLLNVTLNNRGLNY